MDRVLEIIPRRALRALHLLLEELDEVDMVALKPEVLLLQIVAAVEGVQVVGQLLQAEVPEPLVDSYEQSLKIQTLAIVFQSERVVRLE